MSEEVATSKNHNRSDENEGREPSSNVIIQQQGEDIVPVVPDGFAKKIAEEVYGLTVIKCEQLNSFEDKNYHIIASLTSSNPHLTSVRPEGYVLKVVNSMITKKSDVLYAQIEVMRHLRNRGITVQEPVPSMQGENVIFYPFPSNSQGDVQTHAVCLRTFVPGTLLCDVTLTRDLCYKVGEFMATETKALEDFHHPFYEDFDNLWSLTRVPMVAEYVQYVYDVEDRCMINDIIAQFSSTVLPRLSEIRKGYIHGDPNYQNILVKRNPSPSAGSDESGDYVIAGIIDYMEAAYSHPLYDLAMSIAYVMLQAATFDPLEVGGHVIAGYTSVLELPEVERSLLKICVAGRFIQSVVLSVYNHSMHPNNDYLLKTSEGKWRVLRALWDTPADALYRLWDEIQRSYTADPVEGKGK